MTDTKNKVQAVPQPGDSDGRAKARTVLRPSLGAVCTLRAIETDLSKAIPINDLLDELSDQVQTVKGGDLSRPEAMLVAQAHTLDQLFNRMTRQAVGNIGHYPETVALYMKLALKAQSQCARTIEVLNEIKNPRPVAYVAQANMGQNVQVNNEVSAPVRAGACARGEIQDRPTELLEASDGQRLDAGTTAEAVQGDPALAPVDTQHRS